MIAEMMYSAAAHIVVLLLIAMVPVYEGGALQKNYSVYLKSDVERRIDNQPSAKRQASEAKKERPSAPSDNSNKRDLMSQKRDSSRIKENGSYPDRKRAAENEPEKLLRQVEHKRPGGLPPSKVETMASALGRRGNSAPELLQKSPDRPGDKGNKFGRHGDGPGGALPLTGSNGAGGTTAIVESRAAKQGRSVIGGDGSTASGIDVKHLRTETDEMSIPIPGKRGKDFRPGENSSGKGILFGKKDGAPVSPGERAGGSGGKVGGHGDRSLSSAMGTRFPGAEKGEIAITAPGKKGTGLGQGDRNEMVFPGYGRDDSGSDLTAFTGTGKGQKNMTGHEDSYGKELFSEPGSRSSKPGALEAGPLNPRGSTSSGEGRWPGGDLIGPDSHNRAESIGPLAKQERGATEQGHMFGIPVPAELLRKDIKIEISVEGPEISNIRMDLFRKDISLAGEKNTQGRQKRVDFVQESATPHPNKSGIRKVLTVREAETGVYTFIVDNIGAEPLQSEIAIILYGGKRGGRVKEYKADRVTHASPLKIRFVLPGAIFWDDEDSFSGSIEDSNSITKFTFGAGLLWREDKDR